MVKIFVGNLSPSTTQEELTSLFSQFGKVKECGVLKNFGFVHMDSKQEADEAILKLHHYELNGQAMNVELSKGKSRGSTKLHVSNIYSGCTNQELRSKFEVYGSVVECDIVKDYAFVHMERMEHAMEAINALDNSEFQGMLMKVQLSTSRLRTAPGMGDQTGCYVCGEQGHWSRDCGRGQNGSYGGGMGGYPASRGPPRGGAGYRMGLGAPPGREYQAESFIPPITRRLNYDEYGVSAYSQYASRPQAAYQERPTTYDSYGSMDLYEKYRAQASAYQTRPDAIPPAPPSYSRVPFTTPAVSSYSPAPMAAPTPSATAYFSRERSPIRRVVSGSEGYSYEQSRVTPVSRSSTTYTAPRPREGYTERVRYTY